MTGKRAIVGILMCMLMTALPIAAVTGDEEPSGGDMDNTDPMMDWWWPKPGHFNYNKGKVLGNYLNFEISETTGIVTNYTVTVSTYDIFYPILLYEERCCIEEDGETAAISETKEILPDCNLTSENVTVFDSIEIQDFTPVGHPGTFADLFVSQGENALMIFYDRDWNQGYLASGDMNNTVIFEVAEGLEISKFPDDWYDDWYYEGEMQDEEGEWEEPVYSKDDYLWETSWNEIWIESGNTTTSIVIYDGNVTVDNNTITAELHANSYLEISTWAEIPVFPILDEIWYDEPKYDKEMELIENAKEEGLIAGEGWYFEGEYEDRQLEGDMKGELDNWNYYSYDDPTFNMEFTYITDESIEIMVDSQIPYGRIVTINLNDEALEVGSIHDLIVKLDDNKIKQTETLEELIEMVDGNEAFFFALISDSGTTVFVYVPHFSTHTITIESVLGIGSMGIISNILVPSVLAALFIVGAAVVVLLRGKRDKDEY